MATTVPGEKSDAGESDPDATPGESDGDPTAISELSLTELAQELLVAYKADGDPEPYLVALADLDESDLQPLRTDHDTALSFWLNCYNAGTQRLLTERPDLYESSLRFVRFFTTPCLTVAGTRLSLDDIEQGILRGRSKYGLGYLPRFLPDAFEILYRLDELDPRLHFALNCGAASCPAIRAYDPDQIDDQLELATRTYLDSTVAYDPEAGTVRVPRVFLWYLGDFGGRRAIRQFLHEYDVIPPEASPSVRFQSWDWSQESGKFTG